MHGRILVVDVGTSGVRASVVRSDGTIGSVFYEEVLPSSPSEGFVEFDPARMKQAVLSVATAALEQGGAVDGVGIANQRASTILWEKETSAPLGPGIGWQDLRTAGFCLMLGQQGIRLAPNQSATKLAVLLDMADQERSRTGELCYGTVDSWVAWVLSSGELHVTDHTNAAVTGLVTDDAAGYDLSRCAALRIPPEVLPRIVSSSGVVGSASALPGTPPIAALVGDQQGSLIGQGRLRPGEAKATFGTGGMLDCCVGQRRPSAASRTASGCFPIVAWSEADQLTWGIEAVMLSAGSCVEWLRDDLRIISSAAETAELAASVPDAGGVYFVPALLGLGTPVWDFGARGTFVGLTRGSTRAHLVRAVLEGIAHRGADLLEAAEADAGGAIERLGVDGGMSDNPVFLQALANSCGRPIEVAPVTEATTLGAAFLAGVAVGLWPDLASASSTQSPRAVIEPERSVRRERWLDARQRAEEAVPELTALDF